MTVRYPPVDLTKIPFPSDSLSVGALRRLHPDLFDQGEALAGIAYFGDPRRTRELALLVNQERAFAAMVYENVVNGRPLNAFEPDAGVPEWDGRDLVDRWQQFGLAAGPHEGREMLRALTRAALVQAQPHLGGGRT